MLYVFIFVFVFAITMVHVYRFNRRYKPNRARSLPRSLSAPKVEKVGFSNEKPDLKKLYKLTAQQNAQLIDLLMRLPSIADLKTLSKDTLLSFVDVSPTIGHLDEAGDSWVLWKGSIELGRLDSVSRSMFTANLILLVTAARQLAVDKPNINIRVMFEGFVRGAVAWAGVPRSGVEILCHNCSDMMKAKLLVDLYPVEGAAWEALESGKIALGLASTFGKSPALADQGSFVDFTCQMFPEVATGVRELTGRSVALMEENKIKYSPLIDPDAVESIRPQVANICNLLRAANSEMREIQLAVDGIDALAEDAKSEWRDAVRNWKGHLDYQINRDYATIDWLREHEVRDARGAAWDAVREKERAATRTIGSGEQLLARARQLVEEKVLNEKRLSALLASVGLSVDDLT